MFVYTLKPEQTTAITSNVQREEEWWYTGMSSPVKLTQQASNRASNRGVYIQPRVLPCHKSPTVNVAAVCILNTDTYMEMGSTFVQSGEIKLLPFTLM